MAEPDPMEAIRDTFFQECEEQLAELETGLLALADGSAGPDVVHAVFRAAHSIKGGAGAFGLEALVRFAHGFETALDAMRAGRLPQGGAVLAVMLRATDVLADLVRAARTGGAVASERSGLLAAELAALGAETSETETLSFVPVRAELAADTVPTPMPKPTPMPDPGSLWMIRFTPLPALYAKANDAGLLLRELGRLGPAAVTLDASGLPPLDAMEPEGAYLAWSVMLETAEPEAAIRDVFEFVEGACDLVVEPAEAAGPDRVEELNVLAIIAQAQAAVAGSAGAGSAGARSVGADTAGAGPAVVGPAVIAAPLGALPGAGPAPPGRELPAAPRPTIRVDLDRVDRLIDLVGELVINQAMLAERVVAGGEARSPGSSSGVTAGLDELEQLTRSIQDSVMAIRAQPVKSVFARMPRLVREVAALTGKQVRLQTEGEATEVDRTVIEHLADPLTHMVRNAIGHGLESPEGRAAAGKPAEGLVRVAALHRSGRIVIEVADDGAGIDRARVRAGAVAKGLLAADAVLTEEEVDNLIFLPGFSTADNVSDISGRGVGMDVVRRSVEQLGGRIAIASRPGAGSVFTLSLPLTLAVLDGMVVSARGQTLVVPLTAIVETLQPRDADVHGLGAPEGDAGAGGAGGARVIAIRGSFVPLIDAGDALGFAPHATKNEVGRSVALLVEGEDGSRAALLVDAIHGQRQVVIKSLEANYRHVPGVAAATILGDGRVALILDVDAIIRSQRRDAPPVLCRPISEMAHA